ncbi:endonuclease/exonuclease/phosphatase family protein [Archangium minus]
MSIIDDKHAALGGAKGLLGAPVGTEKPNADRVGRSRRYKHGAIYWHPQTDAHAIHGDILSRWEEMGAERSSLGYPISDVQTTPGGESCQFQHGSLRVRSIAAPLTFFAQNMALLRNIPIIEDYKGTEPDKAVDVLISYLRRTQPDVVGLSECFRNKERERMKKELASIYRHSLDGLREFGIIEDGGLLLFSKHPIVAHHRTIYREAIGHDGLGAKGVFHARIAPPNHPTTYDLFLTHAQNPSEGTGNDAQDALENQYDHLSSFARAYSSPHRPALIMGDLNTDGGNSILYNAMLTQLDKPLDLWLTSGDGSLGITFDKASSFAEGARNRLPDDPERHKIGHRIDYFLSHRGTKFWPVHTDTRVEILQSSPGRDVSDHYGLTTRQTELREWTVDITRPIQSVKLELVGFHCLNDTSERGELDEVYFEFSCKADNGAKDSKPVGVTKKIKTGKIHTYNPRVQLDLRDPGAGLQVSILGKEQDKPGTDELLGSSSIRFERNDLLQLLGQPAATRVFPLLTGANGEYALKMAIEVD